MSVVSRVGHPNETQADNVSSVCVSRYVSSALADIVTHTSVSAGSIVEGGAVGLAVLTLVGILIPSVVLLFVGAAFTEAATVILSLFCTFVPSLHLFVWATDGSSDHRIRCGLPFGLAFAMTAAAAGALCFLQRTAGFVVFFVVGCAGGAFGMYFVRSCIVASLPALARQDDFQAYWLALVAVSILCGVTCAHWRTEAMLFVSCFVGGYGVALAVSGLVPACGGPSLPVYAFYAIFAVALIAGASFQVYRVGQRQAEEAERLNLNIRKYRAERGEMHVDKFEQQTDESSSVSSKDRKRDQQDEEKVLNRKEKRERKERIQAERQQLAQERILRMQEALR